MAGGQPLIGAEEVKALLTELGTRLQRRGADYPSRLSVKTELLLEDLVAEVASTKQATPEQ